ncbi:HNH endonuclease [Burkholderia sola]|uniref:HNH endonuclease n=1 Tax=Burkholderia sola TaxID=2843302 RepID=UPI0023DDF4FE|nr:HNH endonuclease [Burkholderia sola]MDF3086791.1 HNH endonuclease [Burkholderia sola]
MSGFNRLSKKNWSSAEQERIDRLFSGDPKDWLKQSLAEIRRTAKEDLLTRQKYRCAYCRREIADEIGRVELDHVIPKSELPQFTYHRLNLVATCKRCNHRKREHNPLRRKIKNRVNYPLAESAYAWVHPYVHKYSKHIRFDADGFYRAVKGSPSGLAVITQCALSSMYQVVVNRKKAIVTATASFEETVLRMLFEYPNATPQQIAQTLSSKYGSKVPEDFLRQCVERYRGANYNVAKQMRSFVAVSPYAKHLR